MHLSSILKEYNINIEQTKLARHPLSNERVRKVYDCGMIEAYQSVQKDPAKFDNCKYIVSFIGKNNNEATFIGLYEIIGVLEGNKVKEQMPQNYPYEDDYDENHKYYQMKKLDVMQDMVNRLVINWGNGAINWCQSAKNDKEVVSLSNRAELPFPGYEKLILTYSKLGEVIYEDERYIKWVEALKNVNCIYLICDSKYFKQYIGSTYNKNGIYGRWKEYYDTQHGGDELIKKHLNEHGDAYKYFQFTILKILPLEVTQREATNIERIYKEKLNTLFEKNPIYGMNGNL